MNRVTIFGDFHSNLRALEADLADMDQRELSPLYCLGDLFGYGTFPNELIETIGERNIPTLIGNYDQGVGHSSDDCGFAYTSKVAEELGKRSIAWSNEHTTHENKHYVRQLTGQIPLELGELRVQLVHGSRERSINIRSRTGQMQVWNVYWT